MVKDIELPVVFKNQLLMSPGIWNGLDMQANSIEMSLQNTKWNKKNSALIYSHAKEAEKWVGNILNPKTKKGSLYGDLEIWDRDLGIKLKYGKAPLGVSARFGYMESEPNVPIDMFYENFSVVYDPACKPAMINFKQDTKGVLHTEVICNNEIQIAELEENKKEKDESDLISVERGLSSKTMEKEEEKIDEESKEESKEKPEDESKDAEFSALKEKVESLSARVAELEEEPKEPEEKEKEEEKSEPEKSDEEEESKEEESKEKEPEEKISEMTEAAKALQDAAKALKEAVPKTTAEFGMDQVNKNESANDRLIKELGF